MAQHPPDPEDHRPSGRRQAPALAAAWWCTRCSSRRSPCCSCGRTTSRRGSRSATWFACSPLVIGGAAVLWLVGALILRSAGKVGPGRLDPGASCSSPTATCTTALSGVRIGGVRLGSNAILLPLWGVLAVGRNRARRPRRKLAGRADQRAERRSRRARDAERGVHRLVSGRPNASGATVPGAGRRDAFPPGSCRTRRRTARTSTTSSWTSTPARQALRDDFGYDNSPFLELPEEQGVSTLPPTASPTTREPSCRSRPR